MNSAKFTLDDSWRHPKFPFPEWKDHDISFLMLEFYWAEGVRTILGDEMVNYTALFDTQRNGNPIPDITNQTSRRGLRFIMMENEENKPQYPGKTGAEAFYAVHPFTNNSLLPDGGTPLYELGMFLTLDARYLSYFNIWCGCIAAITSRWNRWNRSSLSMKQSFQWQIRQRTLPKTEDWHSFAAACGMDPEFFRGPVENHPEQPTTCFTLTIKDEVCAVAVHFSRSCECGLWVAPSRRGQGLGRLAFSHLVAHATTHLYATVTQDSPSAGAMEHLLGALSFQRSGKALGYRIWLCVPPGVPPEGIAEAKPPIAINRWQDPGTSGRKS